MARAAPTTSGLGFCSAPTSACSTPGPSATARRGVITAADAGGSFRELSRAFKLCTNADVRQNQGTGPGQPRSDERLIMNTTEVWTGLGVELGLRLHFEPCRSCPHEASRTNH